MTVNYHLTANGDHVSISVVADGEFHTASSDSHANIHEIVQAAVDGDPNVIDLFDVGRGIKAKYERLSDRVSVRGDEITLDGDPAPKAIADAILRHYQEGTADALVLFLERLANNPNPDSVDQLYAWLEAQGVGTDDDADTPFTITDDGKLIGYKGVRAVDGKYQSRNHGKAIVNGDIVEGAIPNNIGDVIEMPRSEVEFNPSVGCSVGLHAGTWNYAKSFADGAVLEVLIDPRDVVSVPHDSSAQKLRVCRYEVLDVIDTPHTTSVRGFEPQTYTWTGWGELDLDYGFDRGVYDDIVEEFEVGDRVRLIADHSGQFPEAPGQYGTVVDEIDDDNYPYVVTTDNGAVYYCADTELELV